MGSDKTECPHCHIPLTYGDNLFIIQNHFDYFWIENKEDSYDHYVVLKGKCVNCKKLFRSLWKHERNVIPPKDNLKKREAMK